MALCVQMSPKLHFFLNEMWSPYVVAKAGLELSFLPEHLKCWDGQIGSMSPG